MGKNNAKIPDLSTMIQAGIDPKTGAPIRLAENNIKEEIKKAIRIIDLQDAVRRYQWFNLPDGLTGELIERMLYYKGSIMFFYIPEIDRFFALPYTLSGNIDVYGRYMSVRPVVFGGNDSEKKQKTMSQILDTIIRDVQYTEYTDPLTIKVQDTSCVLIFDYVKQLSQTILPRWTINDSIIDLEAECLPLMKTSLIAASGVKGIRVADADASNDAYTIGKVLETCALKQQMFVAITSALEIQELTNGQTAKAAEYMLAMQSIDNFRLGTYGIENGGLFEKKEHMNMAEMDQNGSTTSRCYDDGLMLRQEACNIINSIWGLGIWCDRPESMYGEDINMDGQVDQNEESLGGGNNGSEDSSSI